MINRYIFYKTYREKFGKLKQEQVNGLNFLLDKLDNSQVLFYANQYAGILANIAHETAWTFQPIRERGAYNYFKYLIGRLGNRNLREAYDYRGGGFIMTTGKLNYEMMSPYVKKVFPNIDIVKDPNQITNPEVSWITTETGLVKGLYTGRKITQYLNENTTDYYNFRRCINGTDRASLIAGYAEKFYECIDFSSTAYTQADIDNLLNA